MLHNPNLWGHGWFKFTPLTIKTWMLAFLLLPATVKQLLEGLIARHAAYINPTRSIRNLNIHIVPVCYLIIIQIGFAYFSADLAECSGFRSRHFKLCLWLGKRIPECWRGWRCRRYALGSCDYIEKEKQQQQTKRDGCHGQVVCTLGFKSNYGHISRNNHNRAQVASQPRFD